MIPILMTLFVLPQGVYAQAVDLDSVLIPSVEVVDQRSRLRRADLVSDEPTHFSGFLVVIDQKWSAPRSCRAVRVKHARAVDLWEEVHRRSSAVRSRIDRLGDHPAWIQRLLRPGIQAEVDRILRRTEELSGLDIPDLQTRDVAHRVLLEFVPQIELAKIWDHRWEILEVSSELHRVALVNGSWISGHPDDVLDRAGFESAASKWEGALELNRLQSLSEACFSKILFQASGTVSIRFKIDGVERRKGFDVLWRQIVDKY